jgi:3-hydroxypropanoate dehydrogenase
MGAFGGFLITMDLTDTPPTLDQQLALDAARALDEDALRVIFTEARTANGFLPAPVSRKLLERAVELAELGPTSANTLPVRYVFVESPAAKERLKPALSPGNLDKTMAAPVTAIVAADLKFFENIPRTFPTRPEMANNFIGEGKDEFVKGFARDNALLQMGYFIIALRALGLDSGAMGGFDKSKVDAEFFPDGRFLTLYLINIGYADTTKSFPRLPRLAPAEISQFV